jgi:RND family efflux transporter MFP subunit
VLRLVDASKVKMTFQLPEQFISRLENVAAYVCRFDAYPMVEIPAKVYEVGTEALATTRTYPVTLIMDQVEGASILPGMSGRVRVRLKEGVFGTDRGLVVPAGAVFSDEKNQKYVWVVDAASKRVKRTAVTVNRVLSQGLLVEGLSEGAWVVQAGVNLLTDNQQVRLPGNGGSAT